MVAGRRVVLRRAKMDDDEYVADEDEEEEEEEEDEVEPEPEDESDAEGEEEGAEEEEDEDLEIGPPRRASRPRGRGRKARSDDGDDDSDADFDGGEEESEDDEDLEVDTPRPRPRPRRAAKARRRGPKRRRELDEDSDADFGDELEIDTPRPRARGRARKPKPPDDSDEDSDGEEGFEIETPTPKRAPRARRRARKAKLHDESNADSDEDEVFEIETPRPKRAPRARRRARKPKPQDESDTNFGEEEYDGLEDEGFEIETRRSKRAPRTRFRARKAKPHDASEADSDGEEDDGLENEEWEVETPWPKRPPTVRSRRRREEQEIVQSDADFRGEEEEPENEELEVEMPQPASPGISMKQEDQFDADFNGAEEEVEDQEEDEEMEIEMPQSVMYRSGGRNPKQEDDFDVDFNGVDEEVKDQEEDADLETETPPSVNYHSDDMNLKHGDDFDADFNGAEEEFEEGEELETEMLQPTNPSEARGKGRKVKPAGSSRQRHEDDDDYEEEVEDEDEDFEPEVDEEEEDEEEDVEEEDDDLGDYGPTRATKLGPRNHLAKRKPAARRQHRKRKSGSRISKGKTRNGMSARRRRRKGWVADDHEDDEEEDDDEDFVVSDNVDEEVNCRPWKKAKGGRDGTAEPVPAGEAWPSVESDTSEFEFVTSEEEHAENEAPVAEPAKIKRKKGRRKKGSESDSSSDSDYVISEEELKDLGLPQEVVPQLPLHPARRTIVPNSVDGKGKEPEEALKQICGICLSEEQTATIQGVLNCCTHYFCFVCILEWSKVESRCPLCKRRFNTITKSSVADLGLGLRNAPVRVEKRNQVYQPTEDEMRRWLDPYENVVCIECNQGGDDNLMLLCDICDSSAHTFCVGLGREVPEGNWYCGGCRSSVEGPSNAQTQERVVHRAESNINTADISSGSFGRSIPNGVFQRPPPINVQPSLQGFDLNLSPIETPEEDKRAESHIAAEPVSTPTGRHATLDRRRALNRRIRILLFRPRTATNAWQNSVQHDRSTAAGTEQNQRNTSTCTDLSPSCSRPDFMQSQQSSPHLVQSASNLTQCTDEGGSNFREVENAKDELIPIVKKSIKHICARSPLDQSSFTNVARRATHTILALSGIAHNRDRVVATPFPFPSHCCHACDGREPAFLMRTICSSCFNLFVGDVVSHIANMFS